MSKPEINIYSNPEELSRAAAELFVARAGARIAPSGGFFAALSGGTTPRRLYELLASNSYSDRASWDRIHLFQVDERSVPPDHAESNFRMIREALLASGRVPRANFHRIAAECQNAAGAAQQYALELAAVIPEREGGFPRFDLVFLGMGRDGHTASLFPSSEAVGETQLWVYPSGPGPGGVERVTLTFPILNAAAEIVFLVSGSEKAATLQKVLEGPCEPLLLPSQGIKPADGQVRWYVDAAAASRLQRASGSER